MPPPQYISSGRYRSTSAGACSAIWTLSASRWLRRPSDSGPSRRSPIGTLTTQSQKWHLELQNGVLT